MYVCVYIYSSSCVGVCMCTAVTSSRLPPDALTGLRLPSFQGLAPWRHLHASRLSKCSESAVEKESLHVVILTKNSSHTKAHTTHTKNIHILDVEWQFLVAHRGALAATPLELVTTIQREMYIINTRHGGRQGQWIGTNSGAFVRLLCHRS